MPKFAIAFIGTLMMIHPMAWSKTDIVAKTQDIQCTSPDHSFQIKEDSAISPFKPTQIFIDGKEAPLDHLKIKVGAFQRTYNVEGLSFNFRDADINKTFKRSALFNGTSIEFNCVSTEETKFLRKRVNPTPTPINSDGSK